MSLVVYANVREDGLVFCFLQWGRSERPHWAPNDCDVISSLSRCSCVWWVCFVACIYCACVMFDSLFVQRLMQCFLFFRCFWRCESFGAWCGKALVWHFCISLYHLLPVTWHVHQTFLPHKKFLWSHSKWSEGTTSALKWAWMVPSVFWPISPQSHHLEFLDLHFLTLSPTYLWIWILYA